MQKKLLKSMVINLNKIKIPSNLSQIGIKKFLIIIFSIQISLISLILLDYYNIHVPLLRQLISTIYLLLIPGILILKNMNINKISLLETVLYSVGLSISTIMLLGFFINLIYPIIGIKNPLTLKYVIISLLVFTVILSILTYFPHKKGITTHQKTYTIHYKKILFIVLLPFISIIGTFLLNDYNHNLLQILVIILIAIMFILIGFNKIQKELYIPTLFLLTLSILYHNSLVSYQIWGWDIQLEYFLSSNVLKEGYWSISTISTYNSALSITLFAPIFSLISEINLTNVFKWIYPLIFSLVPLGLYNIFQKQIGEKYAILSSIFFISFFAFSMDLLQIARQQIGELFLILLISLIISQIKSIQKSVLLVVFAISLVLSHYALSYIYLGLLLFLAISMMFMKYYHLNKNIKNQSNIFNFILFFFVLTLAWYLYSSGGVNLENIVNIFNKIIVGINNDFLNPENVQGLFLINKSSQSFLRSISKYFHIATILFINLGVLLLILSYKFPKFKTKLNNMKIEFLCFSFASYLILINSVTLPMFASALNTSRIYQISIIFLAPFCIIGGLIFFRFILSRINKYSENAKENSYKLMSIFLTIFFLFNSGAIYEISNDPDASFTFNNQLDFPKFTQTDSEGSKWLYAKNDSGYIYADHYRVLIFDRFSINRQHTFPSDLKNIKNESYIFLGSYNIKNNKFLFSKKEGVNIVGLEYLNLDFTNQLDLIYDNGGSKNLFIR